MIPVGTRSPKIHKAHVKSCPESVDISDAQPEVVLELSPVFCIDGPGHEHAVAEIFHIADHTVFDVKIIGSKRRLKLLVSIIRRYAVHEIFSHLQIGIAV